jgi:hypothetical protein
MGDSNVILNLRIPSSTHTLSYQFRKNMTIREMKKVLLEETITGAPPPSPHSLSERRGVMGRR